MFPSLIDMNYLLGLFLIKYDFTWKDYPLSNGTYWNRITTYINGTYHFLEYALMQLSFCSSQCYFHLDQNGPFLINSREYSLGPYNVRCP